MREIILLAQLLSEILVDKKIAELARAVSRHVWHRPLRPAHETPDLCVGDGRRELIVPFLYIPNQQSQELKA